MTEIEAFEEFEQKPKKPLDIGNAINDAFEIYKKIALPAGSALLIISMIIVLIVVVTAGFFFNAENLAEDMKTFKPENLSPQAKLIYIGAVTLINALSAPFIAGFLKMAHQADHDEDVKFSSIAYYVNSSRFIPIVLNAALLTIINMGLDASLSSIFPAFGNILAVLITIPISILTFLSLPLIIFKDLNFIDAISKSVQLVSGKFFLVLVLFILANILAVTGIIAFCIGIIFTLPIIYAMQYVIFKSLAE